MAKRKLNEDGAERAWKRQKRDPTEQFLQDATAWQLIRHLEHGLHKKSRQELEALVRATIDWNPIDPDELQKAERKQDEALVAWTQHCTMWENFRDMVMFLLATGRPVELETLNTDWSNGGNQRIKVRARVVHVVVRHGVTPHDIVNDFRIEESKWGDLEGHLDLCCGRGSELLCQCRAQHDRTVCSSVRDKFTSVASSIQVELQADAKDMCIKRDGSRTTSLWAGTRLWMHLPLEDMWAAEYQYKHPEGQEEALTFAPDPLLLGPAFLYRWTGGAYGVWCLVLDYLQE